MSRHKSLTFTAILASALALSACGSSSHSADTITLYNGQHEQTTAALVAAFEHRTGIHVDVRSGDEAELANQILQEGASSPADVFYTENTPVLEALRERGMLAPVSPSTLAAIPSRYNSERGRLGRRDGTSVGARLQHLTTRARAAAELDPRTRGAEVEGQARARPVGDGLPAADHRRSSSSTARAAAERWLEGLQANGKIYPDNETIVAQVNNGESALGLINHYYWFRLRAEIGATRCTPRCTTSRRATPATSSTSRAPACCESSSHQADAQPFLAFLVSRDRPGDHRSQRQLRVPAAPRRRARARPAPVRTLQPAPLTPAELGDGREALALEQKLGLL